jgi:hypothetical protein
MVRTSRCFDGIFIQLGGPNALRRGERFRRNLHLADFFFAHRQPCSAAQLSAAWSDLEVLSECDSKTHDKMGEGAACFAAVS